MFLTRLGLCSALLGASVLHWRSQAAAEESAAERLFREGRALVVDGRFAEACPRLEESQRLEPRLGTQLNIAFCHEQLGKLAKAWSGFQEAVSLARREGDVARERFATARSEALAPRVPWLEVRVAVSAQGDPSTLSLDGAPLESSAWGKELRVDPGSHVLVATHGGGQYGGAEYWRTTLVLRESEHANVSVPAAPANAALSASSPAQEPATREASRFVYEVGAFVGFISVDTIRSTPDGGADSIRALVRDENGTSQSVSCASVGCDYPSIGSSAGFVPGVTGFVGYAVAEQVGLGLRFLIGPRAGGGVLVASGPSVSFPLSERFRVGPAVLFGTASHVGTDIVQLSTPSGFDSVYSRLHGTLGFSTGLGAELGFTLTSGPSGSVILQATPLYLYGSNGSAWSLPLGAAYHWN
jgi:hypothetical protein